MGAAAAYLVSRSLSRARRRIPEQVSGSLRQLVNDIRAAAGVAIEDGRRARARHLQDLESQLSQGQAPTQDF